MFLLFASLELITGNFIEPWLYGAHTGISALALLVSTVFWTALWGAAGLILSTPLTVCVVVLGRYVPQFSFLHVILGDEAVLAPEALVYQRLLAMDDQQARAVADAYLGGNSLAQLYDSVIIPALTLAERDRHNGALDPIRQEFLFLSLKEMLVEFSERAVKEDIRGLQNPRRAGSSFCLPAMKRMKLLRRCWRNCWSRRATPPFHLRRDRPCIKSLTPCGRKRMTRSAFRHCPRSHSRAPSLSPVSCSSVFPERRCWSVCGASRAIRRAR